MIKIKTAQYISYPYKFQSLFNRKWYKPKKIRVANLNIKEFVKNNLSHLNWEDFKEESEKYNSVGEKILSIFSHEKLVLGDKRNIEEYKLKFFADLNFFIKKQEPIIFNVTQFAFKIPNPLKTNRKAPDLGELAFLSQLNDITVLINHVYKPGAKIVIYGESYAFRRIVGISLKEADDYFKIIKNWLRKLGWDKTLILFDVVKLARRIPGFEKEYQKNLMQLKKSWQKKEKGVIDEINTVASTLFSSINTRKYSQKKLVQIYGANTQTSMLVEDIKRKLHTQALKKSFPYIAYHQTINTSGLSRIFFPHSLKLSFTYGPNKICLNTISKNNKLYPYHGVAILDDQGQVKIVYKLDVESMKKASAYYVRQERSPFYYALRN